MSAASMVQVSVDTIPMGVAFTNGLWLTIGY